MPFEWPWQAPFLLGFLLMETPSAGAQPTSTSTVAGNSSLLDQTMHYRDVALSADGTRSAFLYTEGGRSAER